MLYAIQGQEASFHHIAAKQLFGGDVDILPMDTFKECFEAVARGKAEKAVVAIENSLYGSINPVYDSLLKHKLHITGEVYLHIEQCLIGHKDAEIKDIQYVHSQIMALMQSEKYLDDNLPDATRIEEHDTVASVVIVKNKDKSRAAIASRQAAELHDMKILARGIETNKQNYTRFVVLSREPYAADNAAKTSIVLRTPADEAPGSLYRALGAFAKKDINLLLLHSRPNHKEAWNYMFYIDLAADANIEPLKSALKQLDAQGCNVNLLGSYPPGSPKA